jgi:SAM-dependent methyltransferase
MLFAYGVKLGAKQLVHGQFERGLRHLLVPVGYWRVVECKLVRAAADFQPTDRILDIGSPKLLSIYLAKTLGAEVYATDIDGYFVKEYATLRGWEHLPEDSYHVSLEDGRKLSFPDNHFDKVYSISVIEHIPDTGDSACAREIGRVLTPGGRCMITVPFWPTSMNVYKRADDFYWADKSVSEGDGRVFFQRRYSEDDLYTRLIEPSGLRLRRLEYVGERVLRRSPREFCDCLSPRPIQAATGWAQPAMSRLFHTRATESWRSLSKPLCAHIVLEKPTA